MLRVRQTSEFPLSRRGIWSCTVVVFKILQSHLLYFESKPEARVKVCTNVNMRVSMRVLWMHRKLFLLADSSTRVVPPLHRHKWNISVAKDVCSARVSQRELLTSDLPWMGVAWSTYKQRRQREKKQKRFEVFERLSFTALTLFYCISCRLF